MVDMRTTLPNFHQTPARRVLLFSTACEYKPKETPDCSKSSDCSYYSARNFPS